MLGKSGMPLNCAIQIKKIGRYRLDSEFRPVNVFNNQLLTVKFVFFYCFQNNFLPCSCTCINTLQNLCKLNHHVFKQAPTNPLPRARRLPKNTARQPTFQIEYPILVARDCNCLNGSAYTICQHAFNTQQVTHHSFQARNQIWCCQSHKLCQPINARVDGNLIKANHTLQLWTKIK